MNKRSYFVGEVISLVIASTALFATSAQGCYFSKSFGEHINGTTTPITAIGDFLKNRPLASVLGFAALGGLGVVGVLAKGDRTPLSDSQSDNSQTADFSEPEYEIETVITENSVHGVTEIEDTLTSVR